MRQRRVTPTMIRYRRFSDAPAPSEFYGRRHPFPHLRALPFGASRARSGLRGFYAPCQKVRKNNGFGA